MIRVTPAAQTRLAEMLRVAAAAGQAARILIDDYT